MIVKGLNPQCTNAEYHGDRTHLSSSSLKLVHKDPMAFYKKYVLNEPEEIRNESALTFGTVAHLCLLEPHLIESEVAIYEGARRQGAVWEKFKAENAGKNIILNSEADKLKLLVSAYENNKQATKLMQNVLVEQTYGGVIDGVNVKVRADALNVEAGYIVDVKTTAFSIRPEDGVEVFKEVVDGLYYDLSAALYADVIGAYHGKPFDFYFLVLSKSSNNCIVYKASPATLEKGRVRINEAIQTYKNCLETGVWEHSFESLTAKPESATTDSDAILEV